jgi:hypothetical protein
MAAKTPAEPARTTLRVEDVTAYRGDALVVNLFEGVREPAGATGAVDKALGGAISTLIRPSNRPLIDLSSWSYSEKEMAPILAMIFIFHIP